MSVKILAVCANAQIMKVLLRLINANEHWEASGSSSASEAIDLLVSGQFDLLLIGSGLTEAEEENLIEYVQANLPDTRIIKHYGGGSGLLSAEIYQALS
jgi:DNA-binding NtrC family response regulator